MCSSLNRSYVCICVCVCVSVCVHVHVCVYVSTLLFIIIFGSWLMSRLPTTSRVFLFSVVEYLAVFGRKKAFILDVTV